MSSVQILFPLLTRAFQLTWSPSCYGHDVYFMMPQDTSLSRTEICLLPKYLLGREVGSEFDAPQDRCTSTLLPYTGSSGPGSPLSLLSHEHHLIIHKGNRPRMTLPSSHHSVYRPFLTSNFAVWFLQIRRRILFTPG